MEAHGELGRDEKGVFFRDARGIFAPQAYRLERLRTVSSRDISDSEERDGAVLDA